MEQVDYYGVHWEGPIGWLVQRETTNALGLKGQVPFAAPTFRCGHTIELKQIGELHPLDKLADDPLFQAMLPLPRGVENRVVFVEHDPDLDPWIPLLAELSSPTGAISIPAWMLKPKDLQMMMARSNLQPWVITHVTSKEQQIVDLIARQVLHSPRPVVLIGDGSCPMPRPIRRITTRLAREAPDIMPQTLRDYGGAVLRSYLRKEPLHG